MPPTTETSLWDFAPVIDLLHSFSANTHLPRHDVDNDCPPAGHKVTDGKQLENGNAVRDEGRAPSLGDFGTLWTFLAQSSPSIANRELSVAVNSGLKDWCLDAENVTGPVAKDGQHGRLDRGMNLEDDVFAISPIKQNGKHGDPKKNRPHKQIDPAAVISISSSVGISHGKPYNLQKPSEPLLFAPSTPPMKILSRPAATQDPKCSIAGPDDPFVCKTPRPTQPNKFLTPGKPPRSPTKSKAQIRPVVTASTTERRSKLVDKLIGKFPEQKKLLMNGHDLLSTCEAQDAPADSIHVFVDASNIMIGLHDCIKVSRNIPVTTRIPRVSLSFHNFSLVLERGRSTAKRVLVGSDRFPAIQEAERIGYEANILDRVHKTKEFTPGRKKFRKGKNANSNGNGSCNSLTGQPSSGSETNAVYCREKWVEQAVDEILHLKILESIVDTEKPSTMVLATGDAAEAEYSGGFMKMVTRALQKGWTIELVSFSLNTSATYKRKEFRSKWGSKFKMIELDGYIEELTDA